MANPFEKFRKKEKPTVNPFAKFSVSKNITGEQPPVIPSSNNGFKVSSQQPDLDRTRALTSGRREPPTGEELKTGLQGKAGEFLDVARPVLEGTGALLGGIAGTPGGPPTQFIGGTLGFAFGKNLSDLLDASIGRKELPKTPKGAVVKTIRDIKTGAQQELLGTAVGKSVGFVAGKLSGSGLSEASKRILRKAQNLGIQLSTAEVLESKTLSLIESVLDKTPFTSGLIKKFRLGQLQGLLRNRNRLIANNGDPEIIEATGIKILNSIEAVFTKKTNLRKENIQALRDNLLEKLGSRNNFKELSDDIQSRLSSRINATVEKGNQLFQEVSGFIEGDLPIPTPRLRKASFEILEEQLNLPVGQQDVRLIQTVRELSGEDVIPDQFQQLSRQAKNEIISQFAKDRNWNNTDALRREFDGSAALHNQALKAGVSGLKGFSSALGGKFTKLSNAIRQDMTDFADAQGGGIKASHDKAKAFWKEWIVDTARKPLIKKFLLNEGTETFIRTFFKPKDQTNIRLVKKALGKDIFNQTRKTFVKDIMEKNDIGRELDRFGNDTLKEIFTPDELLSLRATDALIKNIDSGVQANGLNVETPFFKTIINGLRNSPEKVVELIIRPNNTTRIKQVRNLIGAEAFNGVRVAFLEKLMKTNESGFFSPAKFTTLIRNFGDSTLKEVLGKETFKGIKDLGEVALRVQGAEKLAGNTSGTAQNIITSAAFGAVFNNPAKGIKLLLSWRALGELYTSDAGRTALLGGITTPLTSKAAKVQLWQKLIERATVAGLAVSSSEDNINNIIFSGKQTSQ